MAIITLDTNSNKSYCVFPLPRMRTENIRYLIEKVIVSCQEDVMSGEPVVAAGSSIQYILDKRDSDDTLFEVILTENNNKRSDDDPDFFAAKVSKYQSPNEAAREKLEWVLDQLSEIKILG